MPSRTAMIRQHYSLSSNQLITSAIMNIKAEVKLLNYYKSSGQMFNLINYVAFIQQLPTAKKSARHEDSSVELQYTKMMIGLKDLLLRDSDSLTPRNLSNLYAALHKSRKQLAKANNLTLYFEITDMIEDMIYSVADQLNEMEMSETLSLLVRKERIKPLEGKLVDLAMDKIQSSTTMFICYLIDHLGWRPDRYSKQLHSIAVHLQRDDDFLKSLGVKDYSIFLVNFGKIKQKGPEIESLLKKMMGNMDDQLAKSSSEEFGNICFVVTSLKDCEIYSESCEKLMSYFDKVVDSQKMGKSAIMNILLLYGEYPKREKRYAMGRILKSITKLDSLDVDDLKSVINHYNAPRPLVIKEELQEYLEKQIQNIKHVNLNSVDSKRISRLLRGIIDASKKKLFLSFDSQLTILKFFCYDLRDNKPNQKLSDYMYIMYTINNMKTTFLDKSDQMRPIMTRIYLKAYYMLVKDKFANDPDFTSPSKISTYIKLLRQGLPELVDNPIIRQILVTKAANLCEAVMTPENIAEIMATTNQVDKIESVDIDDQNVDDMTYLKPLTSAEGLEETDTKLTLPRGNVSISDLMAFLIAHKKDIEWSSEKIDELTKYCNIKDPRQSMLNVTDMLNKGYLLNDTDTHDSDAVKEPIRLRLKKHFPASN